MRTPPTSAVGWATDGFVARRCAGWRWSGGAPEGSAPAAEAWRDLLATRGASALARREAREALAIFHEHRARDFAAARTLVLDALAEPLDGRRRGDAEHRLARLERKLSRSAVGRPDRRLGRRAVRAIQSVGLIASSPSFLAANPLER